IGPSVAIAVALMLAAGVTLVPALMRLCGLALFWPTHPNRGRAVGERTERGFWHAVSRRTVRHPLTTLVGCLVLLLPLAASAAVPLTLSAERSAAEARGVGGRWQAALGAAVGGQGRAGPEAMLGSDSAWTHDEAAQVASDLRFILV